MRMRRAVILGLLCSCGCVGLAGSAVGQEASAESGRKLVRKVDPQYPPVAKKLMLGGTVKVVAVVSTDGSVKKVEPVGGSPLLVQAAQGAVSQWKYVPGAESRETIEMHFTPQ